MHSFWKRAGYIPLYLRQTQSELTGEHTCVMVRGLNSSVDGELEWLGEFAKGTYSLARAWAAKGTDTAAQISGGGFCHCSRSSSASSAA